MMKVYIERYIKKATSSQWEIKTVSLFLWTNLIPSMTIDSAYLNTTQTHINTSLEVLISPKYFRILTNPIRSQLTQLQIHPTYSHTLTPNRYSVIHNKEKKIIITI